MNTKNLIGTMLALLMLSSIFIPLAGAAGESGGVNLNANVLEPRPEIGITFDTSNIDFGELLPGQESDPNPVEVTNVGLRSVGLSITVQDHGPEAIFAPGITVNGAAWSEYSADLSTDDIDSFDVSLHLPENISTRGPASGTMVVWAQEQAPSSGGDWSQWQGNEQHYAVRETDDPVTDPYLAWSYAAGGDIDVTPLIVGNIVYVYDGSGRLSALNKDTGALLWSNTTGSSSSIQSSIPAYGDGKIFVATSGGTVGGFVYAFDALTGDLVWSVMPTTASYRGFECPITYHDGRLYVGEGLRGGVATKYYYSLYAENGTTAWKYSATTSGWIWGGAVIVGDHMVIPVFEGRLVSLDRISGEVTDEVDLKSPEDVSFARADLGMIRSSVTYDNGYIYSTSEQGQKIGYLFKTGFSNGQFLNEGWSTPIGFSTSTPVVYNGKVYVGNGEHGYPYGNLTCINDADGAVIWDYLVDSGVKSSPALFVSGDEVYIYFAVERSPDGSVYCVDGDGNLVWEYNPPDDNAYILQGVALSDGAVYFGTDDNKLYCLRNSAGA